MEYYSIEPEVAGELGENTIIDNSVHPPIVSKLHFIFNGWLGDDIIECFPCFIVTERLKEALTNSIISGYKIKEAKIEKSIEFETLYPNRELPKFYWLAINGKQDKDDIFILNDNSLGVSKEVLELLKKLDIDQCDVTKV